MRRAPSRRLLRSALVSLALQAGGLTLVSAEPATDPAPRGTHPGSAPRSPAPCLAWLAEHYPWLGPTAWAIAPACQGPPQAALLRHGPDPLPKAPPRPTRM